MNTVQSKIKALKERRGIPDNPPATRAAVDADVSASVARTASADEEALALVARLKSLGYIITKNDPTSTTPTPSQLHNTLQDGSGNRGIFSDPGVRPQMFSTLPQPRTFADLLIPEKSNRVNERLAIVTGQTAPDAYENADGWCEPGPMPGYLKRCNLVVPFGNFKGRTGLQAIPEIGEVDDYADVTRQILNAGPTNNPFVPDIMYRMADTLSPLQYEFYRFGNQFRLSLERVAIQGNHAVTGANREWGWINEFDGLEVMIREGYVSEGSDTACEAVDSIVEDFGSADIGDTMSGGDGRTIDEVITDIVYAHDNLAWQNGMQGYQSAMIMRADLFRMLTYQIACNYATMRCSNTANNQAAETQRREQLAMLNGQYLLVDNRQIPVYFSDGITRTATAADTFTSSIFFVPVSWNGWRLLRMQYFPMDNQYIKEWTGFQGNDLAVLNNGMYLLDNAHVPMCKEYHIAARMRLILETPFLAGRIDNISYTTRARTRSPYPGESGYVNGGDSYSNLSYWTAR